MALGNRLGVYDKQTEKWMEFGFFDFQGEGALKVSFADLKGLEFKEVFNLGDVLDDSSVLATKLSITTYNTSPTLGLNVINYRPGYEDLGQIGISDYDANTYRFRGKPAPNIVLSPDGTVSLDHSGFFVPIETSHPGALRSIIDAVTLDTYSDDGALFSFNGHRINAVDPDAEMDALILNLGGTLGSHS